MSSTPPPPSPSIAAAEQTQFVGRDAQLQALWQALLATDAGRPVLALLHGPSGAGKTRLVGEFLSRARARAHAVVLEGPCYERESLPFKAFDQVVDALCHHLRELPEIEVAKVVPRDAWALPQLFPVLGRVALLREQRRRGPTPEHPAELRGMAFAALKELLQRIATLSPLVIAIDDLQWGDVDSAELIAELTSGADCPAMLLICTYRTGEVLGSPCLQALFAHTREHAHLDVRPLALGPLSPEESYALARELLGQDEWSQARRIGTEAQGSPFLLTELAAYLKRQADRHEGAPASVSLERVLAERLARLGEASRTVLQLLAVAGSPLSEPLLSLACGFELDVQNALSELRAAHLVRGVATRGGRSVDVYHDQIRLGVLRLLSPQARQRWHGLLATTLEASGSVELETLTGHLLGAGELERAGLYAARAASRAFGSLAFDTAARLYELAIEHHSPEAAPLCELLERLGEALVHAGRGARGAEAYLRAAEGLDDERAGDLRRKAGVELLRAGELEPGLALLGPTLSRHGIELPRSRLQALRSTRALRKSLRARGLGFSRQEPGGASDAALAQVDAVLAVVLGLLQTDLERATPLVARLLWLALEAGEPSRVAVAASLFHVYVDIGFASRSGDATLGALELAQQLAQVAADSRVRAWLAFARGNERLRRGELRASLTELEQAEEIFRNRCSASALEMRLCRQLLGALYVMTVHVEELPRCEEWAREADDHDDVLGATRLMLLATADALAQDDPEKAARVCRESQRAPRAAQAPVTYFLQRVSESLVEIYRGDPARCRRGAERLRELRRSALSWFPAWRAYCHLLGAQLWLAGAATPEHAARCVARAEAELTRVEALALPCFAAQARLLRAVLAARGSERDDALRILDAVLGDTGAVRDVPVLLAYARRYKGELVGGSAGRELMRQSDAYLRARGVRRPELLGRLFAPSLPPPARSHLG